MEELSTSIGCYIGKDSYITFIVMSTKEQYWKYSLIVFIIGLGILMFKQMAPFLGGLLGALTIYILVRNQMLALTEKRQLGRSLAATIITVEAVLCFLLPIGLVTWAVVDSFRHIDLHPQAFIAPLQEAASIIRQKTGYDLLSSDMLSSLMALLPHIGQVVMSGISSFIVNVCVLVFVLYFMLIGGRKMEQYVSSILPFNDINTRHVTHEITLIIRSNAIGIPLLAVIQGIVATFGYWICGAPNLVATGALTCLASLIPMVGTALVWFPVAAFLALTGHWLQAIGLAAYGMLVISQSDNLIRFIIQKRMADIHPLITVFGVVIGLPLFGFMGIIFGPLLLSLFCLFVNMFRQSYLEGESIYIPHHER